MNTPINQEPSCMLPLWLSGLHTKVEPCCFLLTFSGFFLRHYPAFWRINAAENTVSWSAAKSGQIPEVLFYWAFLICFSESFGIIQHFCSNRKNAAWVRIWRSPIHAWNSLWHSGQTRFVGMHLAELLLALDLQSCLLFLTSLTLSDSDYFI